MTFPDAPLRSKAHRPAAEGASSALQWPIAPETVRLEPSQIHLWAAGLNELVDLAPELGALLPLAEQSRAEKFRSMEDRLRFVIRHGLLRQILSHYLDQLPGAIEFQRGAFGKPEVRCEDVGTRIFSNTSHSVEIAVCAITTACPIGVDVERLSDIPEIEAIARRFFLPRETQTMMALPPDSRLQGFYNCWTRKEAVLKATGEGIAESLAKVEVTLAPEDKPAVVSVVGDRRAHEEWQLQPFSPAPGYIGCIAYRNPALTLKEWRVTKARL